MKNLLFALLLISFSVQAQSITNFTLPNANNGESVSLNKYSGSSAVVVVFITNECPYDNYYKTRIKQLIDLYPKVQFLLINSSGDPQESIEKMAIHYTDLNIPYLADKDQKVMELFRAKKSPEAFLLRPTGDKFTVAYSGAIDDNPQVPSDTKENFLKNAIDLLLRGQEIEITTIRAMGCTIRKK